MAVHALVEALGIDLNVGLGHRSLTELHPRTGAEDALAIDRHPRLEVVEHLRLLLIVGTVSPQGDAQKQVAVL